jgi:hypothetical protein
VTMVRRSVLMAATVGVVAALLLVVTAAPVQADGTETLGVPSTSISDGTGVATGGVGLRGGQPGAISVSVPSGATVNQVLLYWEGQFRCEVLDPLTCSGAPDATAVVNGTTEVTGALIGGPAFFSAGPGGYYFGASYRADITSLGAVTAGANVVSVGGLTFNDTDGAGIVAIYTAPGEQPAEIDVVDGIDLAFRDFGAPADTTVPQTFAVTPAPTARTAELTLLVASVPDATGYRPTVINVTSGGATQTFEDQLASANGAQWDTLTLDVNVPANATSVTVQILSDAHGTGALPASFIWTAAALTVPELVVQSTCTRTANYWLTHTKFGPGARDAAWNSIQPSGEKSPFFSSGKTYLEALVMLPTGRNAYYVLAHTYVAARLNVAAGAMAPASVSTALASATSILQSKTPAQVGAFSSSQRAQVIELARTLDRFSNGDTGPGPCPTSWLDVFLARAWSLLFLR